MNEHPARPAELMDDDYPNPMAPLAEEGEALPSFPTAVPANNPTHRRLRAIAGAGNPYVFLAFTPEGQVAVEFWGVEPDELTGVLRDVAGAVEVPA